MNQYSKMECVIRDHLISSATFQLFVRKIKCYPIQINGGMEFLFYNYLNNVKWKYVKKFRNYSYEEIITFYDTKIIGLFTGKFGELETKDFKFSWDTNGEITEEKYYTKEKTIRGDSLLRFISYESGTKIVIYDIFSFIYDLEIYIDKTSPFNFLTGYKFQEQEHTVTNIKRYEGEELNEIANGNLDLVNSDFNIFFYVDNLGKVNVVEINNDSKYHTLYSKPFGKCIKDNPNKIKEEAEKLRLDSRNYVPKILDPMI